MTAATAAAPGAAPLRFISSTIGRKIVMAVTGALLVGFVVAHMAGNLQMFLGPQAMHDYAVFLRHALHGTGLWIARAGLLAAAVLHIWAATTLTLDNRAARPSAYRAWTPRASTLGSRTMRWSGYLLLAYIVYHLLHMTFGSVHPDFIDLEPYHNLVVGFQSKPAALAYIGAMILLFFHLDHGIWSMIRTLGYISIPVAVLTGALR